MVAPLTGVAAVEQVEVQRVVEHQSQEPQAELHTPTTLRQTLTRTAGLWALRGVVVPQETQMEEAGKAQQQQVTVVVVVVARQQLLGVMGVTALALVGVGAEEEADPPVLPEAMVEQAVMVESRFGCTDE